MGTPVKLWAACGNCDGRAEIAVMVQELIFVSIEPFERGSFIFEGTEIQRRASKENIELYHVVTSKSTIPKSA